MIKTIFSGIGYLIVGVLTVILIQIIVALWPVIMGLCFVILVGMFVVTFIKELVKK